ncbi:pimeloyl-ACP methyl ester carboxylesterase [Arthrobacter oryzae]|uniref:alpha/beta hydrolase n=1 Tax=Arthrobacter oryzae TaxID=409290 RepID=UPI002787B3DB|nr:alpha/beta hydrolase [Arthrobacter oryzae]MDP9988238.1 pimeloyl-ACP methyl ester carboxylesterase [Arthrobacter oryzae]
MTAQIPRVPAGEAILSAARRFVASHGRKLRVGEVEWRYVRLGEGPPVLWLTGGLRRAELGYDFLGRLARSHTVVAPDYPPVKRFADFDDGVSAILRAEGIARCDVAGQSYGGLLAQAFLASHPERIGRLVLSSSGPADYGLLWVPALTVATFAARVLPKRWSASLLLAGLTGLLPAGSDPDGDWAAVLRHTVRHDLTRADIVSHFAVAADVARRQLVRRERFQQWHGDAVVLRAENDRTQATRDIPRLQRLLGRPVQTISMGLAGHTAALLEPEACVQWLEKALG